jgi:hypothetical protein
VRALLGVGVFKFQYTGVSEVGKLIRVKAVCQQREITQQATVGGEKKKRVEVLNFNWSPTSIVKWLKV